MRIPEAIVAIHDVSPAWEAEIQRAVEKVVHWGLPLPALLVVPDFHCQWPLTEQHRFTRQIKRWMGAGAEVLLHGYYHLAERDPRLFDAPLDWLKSKLLTAREGEFLRLDTQDAEDRLAHGKKMLERVFGCSVKGFVPPAWLAGAELPRQLRAVGLTHYEGHIFVYNLLSRTRIFAPAITFTARGRWRTSASIGFAQTIEAILRARGGRFFGGIPLRLALHPADFRSERLVESIGSLVSTMRERYHWIGYRELLGERQ